MDRTRMYSTWCQKHTQHEEGFIKWMDEIENSVFKEVGMYLLDLPDEDWCVWYTDGLSSVQATKLVLKHSLYISL